MYGSGNSVLGSCQAKKPQRSGVPQEVHFLATAWIMSSRTSNGGIPPTTPVRRSGTRWLQNYNYDLYCLRVPPAHGYPHVDTRSFSRPEPRFGSTMSCGSLWLSWMSVSHFFSFETIFFVRIENIFGNFPIFLEKSSHVKYRKFALRRAKNRIERQFWININ